ncbi:PhoH family protein, partial [Massilia arenosa]
MPLPKMPSKPATILLAKDYGPAEPAQGVTGVPTLVPAPEDAAPARASGKAAAAVQTTTTGRKAKLAA